MTQRSGLQEPGYSRAPQVLWCSDPLPPGLSPEAARALLGDKGFSLHAMASVGVKVPPFLVITTAATPHPLPPGSLETDLQIALREGLQRLERLGGRQLGDEHEPLLLAVRCSACGVPAGLLPSVTNLGMDMRIAHRLFTRTADDRFVYDCYCRLVTQYARFVHGVEGLSFDRELRGALDTRGLSERGELDGAAMRELARRYLEVFSLRTGIDFPPPYTQFHQAVLAGLRAGESSRVLAACRREEQGEPVAVAVIVQAMVFGNRMQDSFSGVAYTRDPQSGRDVLMGEYAQGVPAEDIVQGRVPVRPLAELKRKVPAIYQQLEEAKRLLEASFRDAQEFEFVVEQGKLWVLQARASGRAAEAAVQIVADLASTGTLERQAAVASISPDSVETMLHSRFDLRNRPAALARGFPASPGAAVGTLAFSSAEAIRRAAEGERVILVRPETDASDVIGMQHCEGILTSTGGMTSHAAVVARGMGKCCVVGAVDLEIDEAKRTLRIGRTVLRERDIVSLDGASGELYRGQLQKVEGRLKPAMLTLLNWADEFRRLRVYANADTPADAKAATALGAEGIGLCRTEHMFFAARRIVAMRTMILAGREDVNTRAATLATLLQYQREDFSGLFAQMRGRPVVIRLIDPPLHEFLPHSEEDQKALARALELSLKEVRRRIAQLHEVNPMLGHRGCRLLVTYPEILQMQVTAIIEAAIACARAQKGRPASPSIMVPLTIGEEEMQLLARRIRETADAVMRQRGMLVEYRIGSMIETPRAALRAGPMAEHCQFLSFGTNDLTQMTLGISRDDATRFLTEYQQQQLLAADPFATIDATGVGELIRLAIVRAREVRPDILLGVCGEHGGDPQSIRFFHECGVDYISCSARRLPMARLAAAQAALNMANRD